MAVDRLRRELLVQQWEAAEAAVPDDLERDALVDRARRPRIDEQREVGVAVEIDEAWSDHLARGVDLPIGRRDASHAGDATLVDADIGCDRRRPRSVDDETVANRDVDAHRTSRADAVASTSTRPSLITTP